MVRIYVVSMLIVIVFMWGVSAATRGIHRKIITIRNNKKIRSIRDAAYDEVLEKCKAASLDGEINYLCVDDIATIVVELNR